MGTEIVRVDAQVAHVVESYPQEKIDLIKRTICKGASDDELQLFVMQCRRTGLDPFSRQIHAVKRWDREAGREVMAIQTGIDGFRLIAERTGKYEGQTAPQWCGEDGAWVDVWLAQKPPGAARIGIYKTGCREPFWGVARWASYVQTKKDGTPTQFWSKMGPDMLAKCAESQAFRKGFPQELSGIYTSEEMMQASHEDEPQPDPRRDEHGRRQPIQAPPGETVNPEILKLWNAMTGKAECIEAIKGWRELVGDQVYESVLKKYGLLVAEDIKALNTARAIVADLYSAHQAAKEMRAA